MSVYLDNAAAAPCDPELIGRLAEYAREFPGNQESMGFHGAAAARRIGEAGERLTAAYGLKDHLPLYGNTGTEVLAAAAEAACRSCRKKEVVTTALEHPALEYALKRSCERHGLRLRVCPADRSGVCMDRLEELLTPETGLVAVHHVQSETGGILDLSAVRAMIDRRTAGALLLADTMQSAGKLPPDPAVRADLMVLSGQKLGAPGGAVLFCAKPYWKTAKALRSSEHFGGRCSVPLALTVIDAAVRAAETVPEHLEQARKLKRLLLAELRRAEVEFPVSLPEEKTSPYILHLLTMPYQGAILTRALHLHEISVAPGSACESETPGGSRALSAMGYSRRDSFCGLRVSFWKENTEEEIRLFAGKLAECVRDY
ncbi:MAG: aminotransferase class V-fold PLP-dependent enzyme [Lentisphaeria bacterium]|nr:aminotransferase class V-fold PLP-dependent enzyme [Lentisphaeria bacterium]